MGGGATREGHSFLLAFRVLCLCTALLLLFIPCTGDPFAAVVSPLNTPKGCGCGVGDMGVVLLLSSSLPSLSS